MPDSPAQSSDQVVTSSGENRNPLTYALIIFGILVVVVIAELGYLYFSSDEQSPPPSPTTSLEEAVDDDFFLQPSETLPPSGQREISVDRILDFADSARALNNKIGFVVSAAINVAYQGTVINTSEASLVRDGTEYVYMIEIREPNGHAGKTYFTQQELSTASVFLVAGSKEEPISVKEIREGDDIVVNQHINLFGSGESDDLLIRVERD